MAINDNPYAAPIDDLNCDPLSYLPDSSPQGFPKPLTLGAIGLILAIAIVAALAFAIFIEWSVAPFALIVALTPIQLAWILFTRARTKHHQETWSPGTRGMVHSVWVLNVLLSGFEAIFAFYLAAAWVAGH